MMIDMAKRGLMEMACQLTEANSLMDPFNNKKKATIMQWHSDFMKRYPSVSLGQAEATFAGIGPNASIENI